MNDRRTITKHLCLVIDRKTKEEVAEYTIEINGINYANSRGPDDHWYYARHQAAARFRKDRPDCKIDWCVDSCQI